MGKKKNLLYNRQVLTRPMLESIIKQGAPYRRILLYIHQALELGARVGRAAEALERQFELPLSLRGC
jgi:hypothetical protein